MDALRLESLVLTLTERCNLRCSYCYVPKEGGRSMSPETADAAVDLLLRLGGDAPSLGLSFFGGEPFLAPELMQRAVARARAGARPGQQVRVTTPTNGIAPRAEDLAWCRDGGVELAISIDGESSAQRLHADGSDATPALLARLPELLGSLPAARTLARVTVTPANVTGLSAAIKALARHGFARVVCQPDFEAAWDDVAIASWTREHQRIATWIVGAQSAGRRIPDLPAWRAIEQRLLHGRPRGTCGAGTRQAAVTIDGLLVPCYRFAYAGAGRQQVLGNVRDGITDTAAVARMAAVRPEALRPERGSCSTCEAAGGCTHFCPATGWLTLGDLHGVPAAACRLMQAQVAAVRSLLRGAVRREPAPGQGSVPRRWAAAALLAAALGSNAACSGDPIPPAGDGGTKQDATTGYDYGGGGVCAYYVDAAGGVCPVELDAGTSADASDEVGMAGGICPITIGGICAVNVP